ncbi:MAG: bifunctional 2-C-methyl-D-erythritol 4-phosphate cytidylyltransferase/2-C-methyl-D-erythritol 2,4-cyclodiphosphate synthase [Micavibrio aeruginosavorus]|uniref:Bifunctional enzyme IspD/IspF n=1 Tax=Micavibrio aeruginosavorus TaxID=349221 RepID=A0A7T5UHA6_9BACT|nr:MAG: bifunctional 2-C-methyl-D-erythritol 4-phosphate cytidylyltransferase/2-C-methyl-D-erythritol 2,4-cyclodiphosphate synthase [Micavibrio aeruginosavorus]
METVLTSEVPEYHVLIVAGGQGVRLGNDIPKQYLKICDNFIINQSIIRFSSCNTLTCVIHRDHLSLYRATVPPRAWLHEPVFGGGERGDSVRNGLMALKGRLKPEDIILIHDAARPFVDEEDIRRVAQEAARSGAATLALPVSDTLRHQDGYTIDRSGVWAIQTPQAFRFALICEAHDKAAESGKAYTDDSAMVAAMGHPVSFVNGSRQNFKITTAEDLRFARMLVSSAMETRTGSGYDVHAFRSDAASHIRLCGVDVPHSRAIDAHSDGDVALHALTDALLSTVAAGDIGVHFPPSEPQWKNADSALFLRKAVDLVTGQQGRIVNLDITIVCERPKVGPHREAMQRRISQICGVEPGRVSVKATTSEKLGFTGREEGIVAQALATVEFPRL